MADYKYDPPYSGSGSLTREQFLFHETRIVAKLLVDEELNDDEIIVKAPIIRSSSNTTKMVVSDDPITETIVSLIASFIASSLDLLFFLAASYL